ncbi:MAG: hypothetical protein COA78_06985 [Blastopirellula sp.]|nr:MAG: hypothetical protein COA78_06985 [Blastopirellula sp.]
MAKCKIEIIRNGVFFSPKPGEEPERALPIGTQLTLEKEPVNWVGKYRVLGKAAAGSKIETGKKEPSAELVELRERFADLGGEGASDSWGVPAYKKAIKAIEEANANANDNEVAEQLDALKARFVELEGEGAEESWGVADYETAISAIEKNGAGGGSADQF